MMILAGDIGGTKTIIALYDLEKGVGQPVFEKKYPSAAFPSLAAIVQDFLDQTQATVETASFGVAGPVVAGKAHITNLSWVIDANQIKEQFKLQAVDLLNDLEAIAKAIPFLEPEDLHLLSAGKPVPGGSIAVIAPGTGLGEAYLTWDGERYRAHSSEGGHADFAPTNSLQIDLLRCLQNDPHIDHVSYELVCSGKGLKNIYAFLKESPMAPEPTWVAEAISGLDDPVPFIINTALEKAGSCEICDRTLEIFVSILGSEAGNMALNLFATGGVYLGGGIPPRIVPALEDGNFMRAFYNKGRLSELLADIPVKIILNPKAALFGAACNGLFPYAT